MDIAVLTVSDTRDLSSDSSGQAIVDSMLNLGHRIAHREIMKDDLDTITRRLGEWIDSPEIRVILVTGGTGITSRDVSPEALAPHITKEIPGFGELFRFLSYKDIGPSTIQSRAMAALCGSTLVFLLPGSSGAVRLALDEILLHQLDSRTKPCNFIKLIPRL